MSDSSTPAFTVANTSGWFTVSANPTTTLPTTLTITKTADCGVTAAGCSTSFTITAGAASKTIAVTNSTSGGGGSSGLLSASPSPLAISATLGNIGYASTTVTSSASSVLNFQATITSSCNCLSFYTAAPGTISPGVGVALGVAGNSVGLNNNTTYQGQITVTAGTNTLNIPVSFTVGAVSSTGSLTATLNPNPMNFTYPGGTTAGTAYVTSGVNTTYTATASSSGWLQVNFVSSTTGTSNSGNPLYISANTAVIQFMTTGTYQGYVTLTNSGNSADVTTIPVTLFVNGGGGGTVTGGAVAPTSLTFNYQVGTGSPAYQEILVPTPGTYSISTTGAFVSTSAGNGVLTVPSGQTGTLLVLPAVAGLGAGTYAGSVTLTSNNGVYQSVGVTLNVTTQPVLQARVNGIAGDLTCTYAAGSGGCNTASLDVSASNNSSQTLTVTPSVAWITVEGANNVTPATFTVRITPTGLPNGMNTGTITIAGSSAGSLSVPVAVFVSGGSSGGGGTGSLTLSTSSLSFSGAGSQILGVTATNATTFTVSTPSTCGWLSVSPSGSLTTNQNLTVAVNGTGLTAGQTYSCNISLVTTGGTQTVAVSFTVPTGGGSSGSVTSDQTSLTFNTTTGTNPATQTLAITGANGATGVGYTVTTQSSTGWLSASPTSGTTPGSVTVSVNATGLSTGAHPGFVVISATGGNALQIPVTLNVGAPTTVSAAPASLTYTYVAGSANPAAQQIQVTGNGTNLAFAATVSAGASWLSVTPASGTAPAALNVTVNPGSLNPGTYNGSIVVAGSGGATGSTTINVSLTVTAPLPTISRVTNAASFNTGGVSAGEIITLFGIAMGPGTLQTASPTNGQYPTTLSGVNVTVGGYPAPLIYVRNDQISAIVPYEINRPFLANVNVVVRYLGQSSNGVTLAQVGAAPGVFTVGSGSGQGAILNSNLTVNSAANPAAKGDVVVLYVTGEGVTSPAGVTGRVTPSVAPFPQPVSGGVTVTIDGLPANVQFFGEAPGLVAGVMQINAIVPLGAGSGAVPVVVRVGEATSQVDARGIGTVTVAVR